MDNKKMNGPKKSITAKLGDAVERVGEKISQAGAPTIGNAISNAGDKLEHAQDNKINKDTV